MTDTANQRLKDLQERIWRSPVSSEIKECFSALIDILSEEESV